MAEQPQHAIERARPGPAIATDLDPGEFGLALVVAATWYFAGPWGIVPTVVFAYKIVGARLPALPGATALAERIGLTQLREDWPALRQLPFSERMRYLFGQPVELPEDAPAASEPATLLPSATPAPDPAPTRPRTMPARPRWLQVVNDDPDRHPHALILGPTGAGKTTLATAVMADRGGRVIVLSPKVSAGAWRGAEVVTLDDDASYAPLTAALADLEQEKRDRVVVLRQQGREALEPLTVVFDELQDLTTHVPAAGEWMVAMSSLGRELNMRLIGIGTTDDALNIRGWKASRHNYACIAMTPDRRATLDDRTRTVLVETQEIAQRAKAAVLRPWRGEIAPAVPAVQPRPAGTITPDELAKLAPKLAAKKGYAPTAEDQAALHSLLGLGDDAPPAPPATQQQVVVEDSGRQVVVNVSQTAATPRAPLRRGGISVKDRRRRLAYIEAAKAGESFAAAYKRLGGSRNEMHALFARHKAT